MTKVMRYERTDGDDALAMLGAGVQAIEIEVPDPVTTDHWIKWWEVFNSLCPPDAPRGAWLNARLQAALAVGVAGSYVDANGEAHDVVKAGKAMPAVVSRWIGEQVDAHIDAQIRLPKVF